MTFNGARFDLPFIKREYPEIEFDQLHSDLMYPLRRIGYAGGLKGCERRLGLQRPGLEDLDGFFAVLLWHDFRKNGNPRALETLLAYNIADTVNLAALMAMAYNQNLTGTPFEATRSVAVPALPDLPFQPDQETIDRIRRHGG